MTRSHGLIMAATIVAFSAALTTGIVFGDVIDVANSRLGFAVVVLVYVVASASLIAIAEGYRAFLGRV